ncbi:UNVERIFIED_CONTAM: hypothetical protein FKN15_048494 [Acipenser sinensis]
MEFRRRRCFFVTGEVARGTGVLLLAVLVLGCVCSVSAGEFVKVPSSVNCTVGQDCILNCSFDYRAGGGWDDKSEVNWRKKETNDLVHGYYGNGDWLSDQHSRYVGRTSLFDSVLEPRWDASLLLRNVTEEDAGYYDCEVRVSQQWGTGQTELVLVAAEPTEAAPVPAGLTEAAELSLQSVPILYVALVGLVDRERSAQCSTDRDRERSAQCSTDRDRERSAQCSTDRDRERSAQCSTDRDRERSAQCSTDRDRERSAQCSTDMDRERSAQTGTERRQHSAVQTGTERDQHSAAQTGTERDQHSAAQTGTERSGQCSTDRDRERSAQCNRDGQREISTVQHRQGQREISTVQHRQGQRDQDSAGQIGTERDQDSAGQTGTDQDSIVQTGTEIRTVQHRQGQILTALVFAEINKYV